ncbi:MAG: hypothetical protein U0359_39665 [Byssovorax sp.]
MRAREGSRGRFVTTAGDRLSTITSQAVCHITESSTALATPALQLAVAATLQLSFCSAARTISRRRPAASARAERGRGTPDDANRTSNVHGARDKLPTIRERVGARGGDVENAHGLLADRCVGRKARAGSARCCSDSRAMGQRAELVEGTVPSRDAWRSAGLISSHVERALRETSAGTTGRRGNLDVIQAAKERITGAWSLVIGLQAGIRRVCEIVETAASSVAEVHDTPEMLAVAQALQDCPASASERRPRRETARRGEGLSWGPACADWPGRGGALSAAPALSDALDHLRGSLERLAAGEGNGRTICLPRLQRAGFCRRRVCSHA